MDIKDNFIEELRELCKRYDVSLYGNILEKIDICDEYDEYCIGRIVDCRKNLTQPEK